MAVGFDGRSRNFYGTDEISVRRTKFSPVMRVWYVPRKFILTQTKP